MGHDEVVRRVWERDRQAHEAAEEDALGELRSTRRAAYAVLGDIRRNIPALMNANEMALKPLRVSAPGLESVQTAGWLLHRQSEGEGYYSHYYLLADGRLAEDGRFVSDERFWEWVTFALPSYSHLPCTGLRAGIEALYQGADLPVPAFPAVERHPQAQGLSHDEWQRLYRKVSAEPLPEPPSGVRFYAEADFKPAPPPPPQKRNRLGFRR